MKKILFLVLVTISLRADYGDAAYCSDAIDKIISSSDTAQYYLEKDEIDNYNSMIDKAISEAATCMLDCKNIEVARNYCTKTFRTLSGMKK